MRAGCVLACLLVAAPVAATDNPFPDVASAYLVKLQNREIWAANPAKRLAPASLTKIMTALVALDTYRPNAVVAVGRAATRETGSRLGLRAGDRMRVADLFVATLIGSANDACHALADWRAGNEARFVRLMNRRAAALRLSDTHFVNTCGHDAPGHYSSARDLAVLAEEAMRHPVFAAVVATQEARLRKMNGGHEFTIENTNALLGRFPGAIGIKTGYTQKAGSCLVALAEREGRRVLLVFLNASNRWWDAHDLLDRAFALAAGQNGA